ncbi:NADH-quinone oxidoreductase subunit J family protein [Aliarcobacter skirrowii]|uniref:NADH-quinone oxidoreductase subunit J n=1 Tax=Aliarcobacter skirrowii TaxID=28200 RepID=A0A2U2C1P6_9BACT|nr:NADH-quinone oxidoreductase subunit J [Aliarcobacter skirrowii]PWE21240.1 NADH-quinone oxidoreductase subunit J [Aliarcobacter skirrowii]PWE22253.1 NADH-quinone oxidoreductase subunit J [Aliarcobacter skirrowii]PWE26229.1 NADH-quinone oxidoreductase subunit J [Aliarcobacter skirrowii]RJO55954.1 NADH-quinone oxidoreductase subunit J [Aliarcobacter skirrowii]RJO58047.1 NADH-quinone oxidoreductase subunit J [Aliarcobacter skirrowii]
MADIIFIALAFFAITGAFAMLVYKSPMYSALGLLITMLSIAGMFALLNATLLFMVQIIVYAGAIMALLLFILMFLNIKDEDLPQEPAKYKLIALGVALMIPLNILVLKAVSNLPSKDLYPIENSDFGDIKPVGMILYNEWIIAFELISILLLIALVGSVVLAKKRDTKLISKGDE